MSEISQAYGAVSVPLSVAALAGVALSLFYQAQQTRIMRDERDRAVHREMVYLAIEDPKLAACWEPPDSPMTFDRYRQLMYVNLIMGRWNAAYRLGDIDEATLRSLLAQHFRGEIGRLHWAQARTGWLSINVGGRTGRSAEFAKIAEESYRSAIAVGPAVAANDYFR
ncbi:DUF6082 family protein [Streptomyces osmaniensis]|uniref:DUF6082 family protein n=1 Tax=Streptomyces osmaniensis TaxID=593134 RepID=UPI001C330EAA|nr:hypothetical protein KJK32_10145 [Streptomyces sp. JCM17656]